MCFLGVDLLFYGMVNGVKKGRLTGKLPNGSFG